MYFLIGIWGGPRREYAAIKFFLYTLFGSVLMLLAMLALYFNTNPNTFDMTVMMAQANTYSTQILPFWPFTELRWGFQHVVWIALFIGFAIKIPAFPFQNGYLRDSPHQLPDDAGGDGGYGLLATRRARRLEYHLRRAVRDGAD
jgi:NADH-quinone oxidoreductase subunit M